MRARAVFLDRDGVLNANIERDGRPVAPTSLDEFRLLPGVEEAARLLKQAGYLLIVFTNQPDIATGRISRTTLEVMHARLRDALPIDEIKVCPHVDADNCECRKPKPGMLLEAAKQYGIDLSKSVVVGDRWRDILAGQQVGCLSIYVDYGFAQERECTPNAVVRSLREAADVIKSTSFWETPMEQGTGTVSSLRIKIFADGADLKSIRESAKNPLVKGFTTNPTLMRGAGVTDYRSFALEVLAAVPDRPISFEVFADDLPTMGDQAREIASWGDNVYVKIPVTNTKGEFCGPLLASLSAAGIKLNVTAVMTVDQVSRIASALDPNTPAVVSVFAGRIADTGRDPEPLMKKSLEVLRARAKAELLWASPRELLNIFQADNLGCHIITITPDMMKKLALVGKNLDEYSRETVSMFYKDAVAANFDIPIAAKRAVS